MMDSLTRPLPVVMLERQSRGGVEAGRRWAFEYYLIVVDGVVTQVSLTLEHPRLDADASTPLIASLAPNQRRKVTLTIRSPEQLEQGALLPPGQLVSHYADVRTQQWLRTVQPVTVTHAPHLELTPSGPLRVETDSPSVPTVVRDREQKAQPESAITNPHEEPRDAILRALLDMEQSAAAADAQQLAARVGRVLQDVEDDLDILRAEGLVGGSRVLGGAPSVALLTVRGKQRAKEGRGERRVRADVPAPPRPPRIGHNDVFVVHGWDPVKYEVARFIEGIGLRAIILAERPRRGRTLIEQIENSSEIAAAVVLLTGDDIGGPKNTAPENQSPRARQNVVFELGYFAARIGRGNVVALHQKGVELPSDYAGVLYVELDERGAWKLELAREFQDIGLPIDASKLLRS